MSNLIEHTHIHVYSDEHTQESQIHRCTGVWKIGTTYKDVEKEFYSHIEFRYFNGLKPHWFHRLMARLLLGWRWEEKK
jgi:hypothetical protein